MLVGTYDLWLVALSIVIAITASYAALDMSSRTAATRGRLRRIWLGGGALAMGAGVWSMHYIGMLAFHLPTPVLYDLPVVALSLSAAIFASAVALYVVSRNTMQWKVLISGSVIMGAGISAMHYIGMGAMRLAGHATWNIAVVALSILIAVIVSLVALFLAFQLRSEGRALAPRKLASAAVMGFAIIAMHYTGMAAATFQMSSAPTDTAHAVNVSAIGIAGITIVTFLVLGLALGAAILDRRFTTQQHAHQREEKRHRDLIQRSPAGVHWSNMDGRITDCNEACARILGYSSREALLQDPDFEWDNTGTVRDQVMANFGPDGRLSDYECWLTQADGTPVCVVANATLLTNEDGAQIIEGTMIDITARKIAEDELLARDRQLRAEIAERERMESALHLNQRLESVGQLAAGIAHEINTPVQFVSDSVHFLRESLS
ncbi:MAG: MHYT domain-containing protein, partial [Gemmatimonadaceae bacterium]